MRTSPSRRQVGREVRIDELYREADAVDATGDERVKQLLRVLSVHQDPRLMAVFDQIVGRYREAKAIPGLPQTRSPVGAEVAGRIRIGRTRPWGAEFGFDPAGLSGGLLIAGQQQRGKTTTLLMLMSQVAGRVPIFAIDCKRKLRRMKGIYPRTRVIRMRDWRGNLHQPPPNVPLGNWLDVVSEVFCESFGLLDLSQSLYLECLHELCELYERRAGPGILPTYLDVMDYLDDKLGGVRYGPQQQARDRIKGRIRALRPTMGGILDVAKGYSLGPFIRARDLVIFEIEGMRIQNQRLFGKWLLAYLYYYLDNNEVPEMGE